MAIERPRCVGRKLPTANTSQQIPGRWRPILSPGSRSQVPGEGPGQDLARPGQEASPGGQDPGQEGSLADPWRTPGGPLEDPWGPLVDPWRAKKVLQIDFWRQIDFWSLKPRVLPKPLQNRSWDRFWGPQDPSLADPENSPKKIFHDCGFRDKS